MSKRPLADQKNVSHYSDEISSAKSREVRAFLKIDEIPAHDICQSNRDETYYCRDKAASVGGDAKAYLTRSSETAERRESRPSCTNRRF